MNFVYEMQLTRHLETGDMRAAMRVEFFERRRVARPRLNNGGYAFAKALVGHADDDRIEDFVVGSERGLYLLREDLFAAAVDAV